ncbi:MAG: Fic family protein [Candidatus Pacebacteria bacterium]|nr:Fic family protein [Candidatus Paceibacterota bacterium]PIR60742.1 MAG: hypothetical protein COU68_02255 [Candidatus Pacebacteria bacterium CG10_big_fil_rev_8_21_14_0_10_45_6]
MTKPPQFFLEKPNLRDVSQEKFTSFWDKTSEAKRQLLLAANEPKYLYWDTFKHKVAGSKIGSPETLWANLKEIRKFLAVASPITDQNNKNFSSVHLSATYQILHELDMLLGGKLFDKANMPQDSRESYITRGVMEEAISSSQLEGAHTTRAAAKKLLIENRKPQNESEQMIVNNYKAMLAIDEEYKHSPLSEELLFELHSVLTTQTLGKDEQKRFRRDSDNIVVQGNIGSETVATHVPPNEIFLRTEMARLIRYANDNLGEKYLHPILKAILLHFWIGYLHPFTDGNGRLARALFYWYLLRHDYWAISYIPLSTVLKKSPMQYAMAYIYSEQDDNDVTYFIDYQLRKMAQAAREFQKYIETRVEKNSEVKEKIIFSHSLNERQQALLVYFLFDAHATATTSSHSLVNRISRQTAAKDLSELRKLGLLQSKRAGKFIRFFAGKKLRAVNTAT